MILSSILHREFLQKQDVINVLWTPTDNIMFKNFIDKCLDKPSFLEFDHTYFGFASIDIIICNSRISHLEKCIESAKYFHSPLLIVDHDHKPRNITIDTKNNIEIEPTLQIAISDLIYDSWGRIHDKIMLYDTTKTESINQWRDLIYDLIKSVVKIKDNDEQ
jgi:hypothetical protein